MEDLPPAAHPSDLDRERSTAARDAGVRRILVRNSIANGLNYAGVVLSALILTPLIIRGFGTAVYGIWILVNQLTGYAGLLDLGVQPAVSKRVAEARARGSRGELRDFLASAFCLGGGVAVITLILGVAFSLVFPGWFHLTSIDASDARLAMAIVTVTTAVGFPNGVLSAVMKGELRFDLVSWINIVAQVVRVIGLLAALHFHGGVVGLAVAGLLSSLVAVVVGVAAVRRLLGPAYLRGAHPSWADVRSIGRFGFFTLLGTAGWYLSYATDAAMIGANLTVADVGHFGLAMNVVVIVSGVVGAFSGNLMPLAAELESGGRHADTQRTYLWSTRICATLTVPAVLVFLVAGPDLLSLWVGPDFGLAAGAILQILAIAHFAVIVDGPGLHMGVGVGLNRRFAWLLLGEGVSNIALSYVLVKRMGVLGVAIGTLVPSLLFHALVLPLVMRRRLGISTGRYLARAVVPALWPLGPTVLVGLALRPLLHPAGGIRTVAWATAMALTYCLIGALALRRTRIASSAAR